jgi:hypothetical protein
MTRKARKMGAGLKKLFFMICSLDEGARFQSK